MGIVRVYPFKVSFLFLFFTHKLHVNMDTEVVDVAEL